MLDNDSFKRIGFLVPETDSIGFWYFTSMDQLSLWTNVLAKRRLAAEAEAHITLEAVGPIIHPPSPRQIKIKLRISMNFYGTISAYTIGGAQSVGVSTKPAAARPAVKVRFAVDVEEVRACTQTTERDRRAPIEIEWDR